ncbi:pyridoxamine 5'-phosphate oxidase family protein [Demequina sp. SO4-13]|uniref:pyridoxamine 5'-phosphate oxidase family protein n=1 Tax=Demequina sp. SO4-13 TaxID=3401027 RepID=UPI003AF9A42D
MAREDPESRGYPGDPMDLSLEWLPGGVNQCLMTLSTLDAAGAPDSRTMLLSEVTRDGFFFHTDALSNKCAQIAADARVTLTILLAEQGRQLVVQGTAEPADAREVAQAYRDRGPYLQQLAWMNTDEFAALDDASRVTQWAQLATDHTAGFTPPATWTGYVVRPRRLRFWEGAVDTASRRVEYVATDGSWETSFRAG